MNRTMPGCTIIPVLAYENVSKAIIWLADNFGFSERWRAGNHRAQLMLGSAAIVISEIPATNNHRSGAGPRHSIMVRVKDVNAHYEKTKNLNATIIQAPTDYPYGERQYTVIDIGGHVWTFSESIADVAPEDWGGTSAENFE